MKNLKFFYLAILAMGFFTFSSCGDDEGTTTPSGPSFTITDVTLDASGRANDAEIVAKVMLKNNTDAVLDLEWERTNENVPMGWATAICDHNLCYPPDVDSRALQLNANQEIELKFNFYPDNNTGNGSADLTLYEAADKAGTSVTKSFTGTAN